MLNNQEENINQVIAIVGIHAGNLIAEGMLPGGSETLPQIIVRLAKQFITLYPGKSTYSNYIDELEIFARKKLLEEYGIKEE